MSASDYAQRLTGRFLLTLTGRPQMSHTFHQDRLRHEGLSVSGESLNVHRPSFDRSVILLCVRWYLAYNLSLRETS